MRYFADYIKGKPYQKTVLWENSSPTSNFSDQTITLSDDITNYDLLEVVWLHIKSSSIKNSIQFSVSDIINNGGQSTTGCKICIGEFVSNVTTARTITYVANNQLYISTDKFLGSSSTATDTNIPLKIIGIKKGLGETKDIQIDVITATLTTSAPYTFTKDYKAVIIDDPSSTDQTANVKLNGVASSKATRYSSSNSIIFEDVKANDVITVVNGSHPMVISAIY